MTAGVNVSFGVVKDEVSPTIKKGVKNADALKSTIAKVTGSYRTLEKEGLRAIVKTASAQTKLNRVTAALEPLVKQGLITQERMNEVVKQTAASLNKNKGLRAAIGSQLRSTLTSYIGIGAAVATVNRLLSQQREIEAGALEERATVARGQALAARNTRGFSRRDLQDLFEETNRAALESPNVSRGQASLAVGKAISSTSGTPDERTREIIRAFRAAAEVFPDTDQVDGDAIASFTQTIVDLNKVTQQAGMTQAESLDMLQRVGGQSRIVDTQNLRFFIPMLQAAATVANERGVKLTKDDVVKVFSFLGSLGAGIVDPGGEKTGTAGVKSVKVFAEQIPVSVAKGFAEMFDALRADPRLARRVGENLEGRGVTQPVVRRIVSNIQGGSKEEFDKIEAELRKPAPDSTLRDLVETASPELITQSQLNRARTGVKDVVDVKFGEVGVLRELVRESTKPSGAFGMLEQLNFEISRLIPLFVGGTQGAAEFQTSMLAERARLAREAGLDRTGGAELQALIDIRDSVRARGEGVGVSTVPPPTE